jgi:hypothetical protein
MPLGGLRTLTFAESKTSFSNTLGRFAESMDEDPGAGETRASLLWPKDGALVNDCAVEATESEEPFRESCDG